MSQYPNPPQPPTQWGPPPGPPPGPPRNGVWIAVASGVALLAIAVFAVTAFAAPGFLVDDDADDSSSETSDDGDDNDSKGLPDVSIPPPNASQPGEVELPGDETEAPEAPEAPDQPEAPEGDPVGFAEQFLARVAAGDDARVDGSMCLDDQEWQYEDAVGDQQAFGLGDPHSDPSAPDGILADLTGPGGEVQGRITVVPDDSGSWCVDTFYVF